MNRELKFRGKRIDNGEWVYGGYHKHIKRTPRIMGNDYVKEEDIVYLIIQSGFSDWNMPKPIDCFEVDPATVGQFTGLHDRDGKEIYEGDIAKYSPINAYFNRNSVNVVEWGKRRGGFILNHKYAIPSDCEVLGNIYDNPDLIK